MCSLIHFPWDKTMVFILFVFYDFDIKLSETTSLEKKCRMISRYLPWCFEFGVVLSETDCHPGYELNNKKMLSAQQWIERYSVIWKSFTNCNVSKREFFNTLLFFFFNVLSLQDIMHLHSFFSFFSVNWLIRKHNGVVSFCILLVLE